jgi:dihydrofolate reductase
VRKIVAGLFVTADGATSHPEQWQFPYMGQEVGQHLGAQLAAADTLLLGRRTYQEWIEFWPHQSAQVPCAAYMNETHKFIVSTLRRLTWKNCSLIDSAVPRRIAERKSQPGKNIVVNGSATKVGSLLAGGLLDELALLVHPVVVGAVHAFWMARSRPIWPSAVRRPSPTV